MCSIPLYSSGAGRDPYTCMCVKEEEEEGGGGGRRRKERGKWGKISNSITFTS